MIVIFNHMFDELARPQNNMSVTVQVKPKTLGFAVYLPIQMTTYTFADMAWKRDSFVSAMFDVENRKQWDTEIKSIQIDDMVKYNNMVSWKVHHAPILQDGKMDCEVYLKYFIFRNNDEIFVYQSSRPDKIAESRLDHYTLVFSFWRFVKKGKNLEINHISQVDFRDETGFDKEKSANDEAKLLERATLFHQSLSAFINPKIEN